LQLEPTPPANAFVPESALQQEQERFPLDVFFCKQCAHVQLLDVVDPHVLFEDYVYVSGTSPVFVEHFGMYAQDVIRAYQPPRGALVVDIGSNDGTLLRCFKDAGYAPLGIDPAREIARRATAAGIETWAEFFSDDLADSIRRERGQAAVITANNVFAHVDDLARFLEGIRALLAPSGVFVFEVSYLADVVQKTLFDTIYHEHLSYHSVRPLIPFLKAHDFELIETKRVASHGGSFRAVAQRRDGPYAVTASVADAIALETRLGLDRVKTFHAFAGSIAALKTELRSLLRRFKQDGKKIVGFGAPAKATTLMYHFGIGPDVVDFIIDDSPLKQGLYTPGMHIPILSPESIYQRRPDYLLILAWNFAASIMEKHAAFGEEGGRFIVPLPRVEVH
jgi:SAM-dependent methyltransferase